MAELKKKDVQDIVGDELEKFINKQFKNEMNKYLKDGKGKNEVLDIVKKALEDLYKALWIRKSVWTSEIR